MKVALIVFVTTFGRYFVSGMAVLKYGRTPEGTALSFAVTDTVFSDAATGSCQSAFAAKNTGKGFRHTGTSFHDTGATFRDAGATFHHARATFRVTGTTFHDAEKAFCVTGVVFRHTGKSFSLSEHVCFKQIASF
jgi:hypothetical protein